MLNFRNDTETKLKWWNVVVLMPDNSVQITYARGEDFDGAKRWFDRAKYSSVRSDYKEILEFSKDASATYDEFVKKETELKNKYKI